jgi:ribosomal protein S18 acetylase RimI-like enzyme
MAEVALDNPVWNALTSEQAHLAEREGDAARFPPDVTALAGLRCPEPDALAALARLLPPGAATGLLVGEPFDLPAGLARVDEAPALQMVHDGDAPATPDGRDPIAELGPADAPAMLALAEATRPGPFGLRTGQLGTFLGIRAGDQLIAMAGQRMRLPGLVEVSGVCTDPAHLGRGHAARLLAAQLALVRARGHGVFLHVKADNARAIGLYERFGFRARRRLRYLIVRAAGAAP